VHEPIKEMNKNLGVDIDIQEFKFNNSSLFSSNFNDNFTIN